jgi:hypothetical protein
MNTVENFINLKLLSINTTDLNIIEIWNMAYVNIGVNNNINNDMIIGL